MRDIEAGRSEIEVYRFSRVVFGLNASPFLLNATLRHHALKYQEADPKFVQRLLESFYVDDFVSGEGTVNKAFELYEKTSSRMVQGGFRLRKWLTNSSKLQHDIEAREENQAETRLVSARDHESIRNYH